MSNKVEITRALFKQALREGDFRLAASDMNYENNRNLKDTIFSRDYADHGQQGIPREVSSA